MLSDDFQATCELIMDSNCEPAQILRTEILRRATNLETHPPTAPDQDHLIIAQVLFHATIEHLTPNPEERRQNLDMYKITFPDGSWMYSTPDVMFFDKRLDGGWTPYLVH